MLVVDNASTDETAAIARRFADSDARIRIVTRERLLGIIENWNAAVREA